MTRADMPRDQSMSLSGKERTFGQASMAQRTLAAIEDCNADMHEFRASAQDAANFDLVYDGDDPTPVVDSGGDPTMSLGDVAKLDAAMAKRHGVIVALIGRFADELDRLAGSNLLIDIAAAIDPSG